MKLIHAIFIAAVFVFWPLRTYALSPEADLYVQATALAERCLGHQLTAQEKTDLARLISDVSQQSITTDSLDRHLIAARTAFSDTASCTGATSQVHLHFFNRSILPSLHTAGTQADSSANAKG